MNLQLILFIFIIHIFGLNSSISDEIWNKTKKFIKEGKMILNKNKTNFIFDEGNYTKLDINSSEMQYLYNKQEQIYQLYNIRTYFFLVEYLSFKDTLFTEILDNLEFHINNDFKSEDFIIIAILSIKTRRVMISEYPLLDRKSLLHQLYFIFNLKNYLKRQLYYKALNKIIDDISKSYYDLYMRRKILLWVIIAFLVLLVIGFLVWIIVMILIYCDKKIKSIKNDKENININKNNKLKEFLYNEEASNEFCPICLVKFSDNSDKDREERIAEDLDSVTLRLLNRNENEKIEILECGHKVHSNCISKLKKSNNILNYDCPLCKKKK